VSFRWNTGISDIAAEPVSFPEIVSVPDTGAMVGLAVAGAVLLPDDEHATSPAASASTAVRAARFFISPLLVWVQTYPGRSAQTRANAA
jgi:hypothetical protein